MTSRHLLRGATKRGVFLGGDKNESDAHFSFPAADRKSRPLLKIKKEDDDDEDEKIARHHRRRVCIFAHVLPLFLLDDDEWGSRAQHERVVGTRVGIASEICKTRESGEGTRVEVIWISRRRTPFGRKPYWTPSFGIFFPASGVFFVVVIVRYWCV